MRDLVAGTDAVMLLSAGVREGYLEDDRVGNALYFIAKHMEDAAVAAKEAFDTAFKFHIKPRHED